MGREGDGETGRVTTTPHHRVSPSPSCPIAPPPHHRDHPSPRRPIAPSPHHRVHPSPRCPIAPSPHHRITPSELRPVSSVPNNLLRALSRGLPPRCRSTPRRSDSEYSGIDARRLSTSRFIRI